jgi:hypothetical protein
VSFIVQLRPGQRAADITAAAPLPACALGAVAGLGSPSARPAGVHILVVTPPPTLELRVA